MRILITGAAGFVGSAVLQRCLEAGETVAVLLRDGSDTWRIDDLLPAVTVIRGDLADLPRVEPAITVFGPEAVIHLAWRGVGNRDRNDPAQLENLGWTLDLVRLAGRSGASAWVGLGSQAEYGPRNARLDEAAPTTPSTVYGVTKLCTALLAQQLAAEAGLRFAWLRIFSAYGAKDDPAWMIPYVIHELVAGRRPSMTDGTQLWDYVYVDDAADAIYRAAVQPGGAGIFNLGSGHAIPVRDIVSRIAALVSPGAEVGFGEVPHRPDQVMHLEADVGRLRRELAGPRPSRSATD